MATDNASLRPRLIGAWRLESYLAHPSPSLLEQNPSAKPTWPMTKHVTGIIMYTPDGYMSAQMSIPGQTPFSLGSATTDEWAEAGRRYMAYTGRYFINKDDDDGKEYLRHEMMVALLPSSRGDVQSRAWRFEDGGKLLVLGGDGETLIKGERRVPELKWRRMDDNSEGRYDEPERPAANSGGMHY